MKITEIQKATNQGPRPYQQDRLLINENLFVVADGTGRPPNGDLAAESVIEALDNIRLISDKEITKALRMSNKDNYMKGDGRGSTAVVAFMDFTDDTLHVHWCGDSRLYTWTKTQGLIQQTADHGVGRYLTQCIDMSYFEEEIKVIPITEETIVILTTDGIHDYCSVSNALYEAQEQLTDIAQELVKYALPVTQDNCTAVCFKIKPD